MAPVQELLKYRNYLSETTALPVQELPVQELPVQELPVRQAGPAAGLSGGCSGSGCCELVAWAAAARVEGGGAVLEVEGAVAALKSGRC